MTAVPYGLAARWRALPRSLRFIVIGGVNTVFGYAAYAALLLFGLSYPRAMLLGTIAGVCFNYLTTGGLVFDRMSRGALVRFVMTYAVVYAINLAGVDLLGRAGLNPYVSGLVLLLPMATLTYLLLKHFVFGARDGSR